VSAYLFDGSAWSKANSAANNRCTGPDCCGWNLGQTLIDRLRLGGTRAILHFWGGCHDEAQFGRAQQQLGRTLLGFYLDDGTSDADAREAVEYVHSVSWDDSDCVLKAYQNRLPSTTNTGLSRYGNMAYVGDLPHDFFGLREGIARVLAKARYLPAPFGELTAYAYGEDTIPEEEVYFRRLHWGCFQVVMAHTPYANCDPWRPEYSRKLLETYRYYAWLHTELIPYLYSYAYAMHENPAAYIMRAGPTPSSLTLGSELFAAFVTDYVADMGITLPSGQWIDYWDDSTVLQGTVSYPVSPGREPILIRLGSIIPMNVEREYTGHGTRESKGALTLLVYPKGSGTVTFRYRDDHTDDWVTLRAEQTGTQLTLRALPGLPQRPVLYRVARWNREPTSIAVSDGVVTVNKGGTLLRAASEREVNGSATNAWFYDAAARRLIVKVFGSPAGDDDEQPLRARR
jgi:hypothetical protein